MSANEATLVDSSSLQFTFPALMMSGDDTMLSKRLHSIQIGGKKSEEERHCRLSVMGASCVGKSAIISQFLYDTFSSDYHETVEDLHRKVVDINGSKVILDILDTAGTHEFPAMRKLAIATSDAFILVYSVDNDASFEEVKLLREQIIDERNDANVPIVIVGNKADVSEQTRIMEHETAETIACVEWGCGYVEASAKQNINIPEIFSEMLRLSDIPCLTIPEGQRTKRKRLLSAPLPTIHHVFETPNGPKRNSCAVS